MDETTVSLGTNVVQNSLQIALDAALDLKEGYIKVQDFDNAAKWRDIADLIKKSILMTKREVK